LKEFIPDQLFAVLSFFIAGVSFGIIRDLFRFIGMIAGAVPVPSGKRGKGAPDKEGTRSGKPSRFIFGAAVFSADVFLSLFAAALFAVMTYALLRGKFRSFSFISAAVGFYLYSILPGKAVRVPLEFGARILRRALSAAARFISVPLRRVVSAAGRAAAFAARTVSKPFVSIAVSAREKRRLKKSKKQKGTDRSRDVTRETVCSVGRRRSF